jgi:hypothetical protein
VGDTRILTPILHRNTPQKQGRNRREENPEVSTTRTFRAETEKGSRTREPEERS